MSAFKHRAVSFGTPNVPPLDVGSSIGPISPHNAIGGTNEEPRPHLSRTPARSDSLRLVFRHYVWAVPSLILP